MTDNERDPAVLRAIAELRRLPATDADAVRRVVDAAAAARFTTSDEAPVAHAPARSSSMRWLIAGVAAAAAFAGFQLSGALRREAPAPATASATASAAVAIPPGALQPAGSGSADALPVARQFVFAGRGARSVSVVGDFNKWNPESARMTRSPDGTLWSVTVPVMPGRHLYGFMVDDSIFVLDPRAPKARDNDLGVDGSVIVVSRP